MAEKTVILNQAECGYSYFVTMGKMIIACGKGGVQKLDILRVIVIADNSVKHVSFLSRVKLAGPEINYDVDVDIFLNNGVKLEVHSSESKFLKKLLPYVWELKKKNTRMEFYGDMPELYDTREEDIENLENRLEIIEHEINLERQLCRNYQERLDGLLIYLDSSSPKVIMEQKKVLASRKKIVTMSDQMNKLTRKLLSMEE